MTCRELADFLMQYTDGELPPETRAAFERHLSVCPSCVAYLESYRRTVRLAQGSVDSDGQKPVPPSVPSGLVQAILAARQGRP